jgi:hypothetical protein
MRVPVIRGVIDRRILVNYRVEPAVLATLLPAPFRPKLVRGVGVVGICLIRLRNVRPAGLPAWLGISSENAAHRAAVEWDDCGSVREGVYVWRRDTDSRLNALAGGRLFPGLHHHARFAVQESAHEFDVALQSDDGGAALSVRGRGARAWPASSVFPSIEAASRFFQAGSLGYSTTAEPSRFEGLELRCSDWRIEPLAITSVRSTFFEDESRFPRGSIAFDSALLMRDVDHEWHARPSIRLSVTSGLAKTPA